MPEDAPAAGRAAGDEFPDDDIGNRISGGAVDVTRAKVGDVGRCPPLVRRGCRRRAQPEMGDERRPAKGQAGPQGSGEEDRGEAAGNAEEEGEGKRQKAKKGKGEGQQESGRFFCLRQGYTVST